MEKRRNLLWFSVTAALFLLKTSYNAFAYYPILDDYIQYISFHFYGHKFQDLILAGGLYAVRPLASLADAFVWSNLWNHLSLLYFIMCCVQFFAWAIFMTAFQKAKIKAGIFFTALFLFLPLGVEGGYWLSASTRIAVPLLFCAAACLLIQRDTRPGAFFSILFCLLSFCFYEQTAAVSFLLILWTAFKTNRKRLYMPIVSALLLAGWYLVFHRTGVNAARGELTFQLSKITEVWRAMGTLWLSVLPRFLKNGGAFVFSFGYFRMILVFLFCILLFWLPVRKLKPAAVEFLLPAALLVLPLLPQMFLQNSWVTLRACVPSIIAFGLFLDLVPGMYWKKLLLPLLIFFSIFSHYVSIEDYRRIYEADQRVLDTMVEHGLPKKIKSLPQPVEVRPEFGEYIRGLTSAEWALTGGLRAKCRDPGIPLVEFSAEGFDLGAALEKAQ